MTVLPTREEAAALTPRPGSVVWRAFGDVRMFSTSGYALILQVAHPTVGAGVGDHSVFLSDPWGRLLRTLDYVHGSIYGGPDLAYDIGRRVHAMHKSIKGTKPDGGRYFALEPKAYAWVHATLATAIVDGARVFGTPLGPRDAEAFWQEWLGFGRLIGVKREELPDRWRDFRAYFDAMVEEELEDNPTVHVVLGTFEQPAPPEIPGLGPGVWQRLSRPLGKQTRITTVGMLPPRLRAKLGLELTPGEERVFRSLAAASRASTPLIRGPLAEIGPHYVRWRRKQLKRGDVAREAPPAAVAA